MEESKYTLETQVSRNGLTVPVINNIYLHSIYNPIKEAEAFADNQINLIQNKNHILILGLGFGYHIEQIAQRLSKIHKNYQIVVLEPNKSLIDLFNQKRPFEDLNIQIFNSENTNEIFEDYNFIQFLKSKPAIIKHDTSFMLNKTFYTSFLKYQAPTQIDKYYNLLTDEAMALVSTQDIEKEDFEHFINKIKTQSTVNKTDFLLLALNEIKQSNKNSRQGTIYA